jgi:hypothetical protein
MRSFSLSRQAVQINIYLEGDEMGETCGTYGREEKYLQGFWWGKPFDE